MIQQRPSAGERKNVMSGDLAVHLESGAFSPRLQEKSHEWEKPVCAYFSSPSKNTTKLVTALLVLRKFQANAITFIHAAALFSVTGTFN